MDDEERTINELLKQVEMNNKTIDMLNEQALKILEILQEVCEWMKKNYK